MIEEKLYQASLTLPVPTISFSQITERAYSINRNRSSHSHRYRMTAAVFICLVLLLGGIAAAATTEVSYSAWATHSGSFRDVHKITGKLGITLPESLDDSMFYNISTMHVVPEGTTYLDAVTNPMYPWYSVDYGVQRVVREYSAVSPDSGYSESLEVYDHYTVSFGSTENELFRYVFSLDESGKRILENTLPGSYRNVDYRGARMQLVTDVQYEENRVFAYHHRVIWEDTQNNVVFLLHSSRHANEDLPSQFPSEMVAFAKAIIDMNI